MNVIEIPRRRTAPARRPHTPLADIDPAASARQGDRVQGVPGRQARTVTFDSAL